MSRFKKIIDSFILGFALFSMLFGAGNLIFPAYLGVNSTSNWLTSFICFILADVGLAMLFIFALLKNKNQANLITEKVGKIPDLILNTAVILCLGPLLAIPRTAATTYKIFIVPNFPSLNSWIFSAIFFTAVVLLTLKPGKVVDIVGAVLTPVLLIGLGILIVVGIIHPIGSIPQSALGTAASVKTGILTGYQTLDGIGMLPLAYVLLASLHQKGYSTIKQKSSAIRNASIIAAVGLAFVYGGLTFLGATASSLFSAGMDQIDLLIAVSRSLLGANSSILLGIIVTGACLTTAIGLTSSAAQYFSKLTRDKVKYTTIVIAVSLLSMLISNVGISTIISIAAPVLNLLYPVMLTLVIMSFFNGRIKNHYIYKGAALGALISGILTVINSYVGFGFMKYIPLSSIGFEWVLPAVVGALLGSCIKEVNIPSELNAPNSTTTDTFALPVQHSVKK